MNAITKKEKITKALKRAPRAPMCLTNPDLKLQKNASDLLRDIFIEAGEMPSQKIKDTGEDAVLEELPNWSWGGSAEAIKLIFFILKTIYEQSELFGNSDSYGGINGEPYGIEEREDVYPLIMFSMGEARKYINGYRNAGSKKIEKTLKDFEQWRMTYVTPDEMWNDGNLLECLGGRTMPSGSEGLIYSASPYIAEAMKENGYSQVKADILPKLRRAARKVRGTNSVILSEPLLRLAFILIPFSRSYEVKRFSIMELVRLLNMERLYLRARGKCEGKLLEYARILKEAGYLREGGFETYFDGTYTQLGGMVFETGDLDKGEIKSVGATEKCVSATEISPLIC